MNKKNVMLAVAAATSLLCGVAHAQSTVLSCVVKTVSGTAKTPPVQHLDVGTAIDVPVETLKVAGTMYKGRDIFNTEQRGERTEITINRETGDFEFTANSGVWSVPATATAKAATGVCSAKKLKL